MERSVVSNPRQRDCISFLPDEILHSILSHIPTKSAIRTSVLSKRWKQVWRETPSISINCIRDCPPELDPTSITKTLRSFSAPKIPTFNLIIRCNVTASQIGSWIELAMSRNAELLSLTVFDYSFPESFFINSSVKQLRVALYYHVMSPTCDVFWPSLRSLSLSNCYLPNQSIANILSGCALLESLTLKEFSRLDHLDLSKSMRLTRLEIVCKYWIRRPLKIVAPHIHYLSLKLPISQPCIIVDVSSLTEANLSTAVSRHGYSNACFDFLQELLLKILTYLQNIEKLTIGDVQVLQFLSLAELRGVPFPQLTIKDLTVVTTVFQSVIPGIVRLLQNSPGLKKITIRTTKHSAILDKELEGYLNTQGFNPDHCWSGKYGIFPKADSESKHVASFIELVLQKAKTLDTMVLQLEGYLSATEFQKLLPMVPTVSFRNKKNVRNCGRGKAILKSFKITP